MEIVLLVGLVVAVVAIGLLAFLLVQVIAQNGRTLVRLEAIEAWAAGPVPEEIPVQEYLGMLPEGYPAPPFSLPDLSGTLHNLSEWRGQRVLLIFFDPASAFCHRLLPMLVALEDDVIPGRPVPVIVSTGSLEENRALFDEAGFSRPVLLDADLAVATTYKVDGAPMAYLVTVDGRIGGPLAVGIQHIMIAAGEMAVVTDATATRTEDGTPLDAKAPLRRTGLREGETAPIFRLPRLEGGEVSLLDYRGRPVFVVFSDPACEPCNAMAPRLEAAHRAAPELDVVMISRGDIEANRAMVMEHGFTFPVALQRHWEISREYGIFATPVAYFVDEWGVIAANVAVEADAVLDLFQERARVAGTT